MYPSSSIATPPLLLLLFGDEFMQLVLVYCNRLQIVLADDDNYKLTAVATAVVAVPQEADKLEPPER